MAAPRRHGFSAGRKRLSEWIGPADQAYVAVASAGATLIGFASFEEPTTIVRTRGAISVIPQTSAADVDIVGAFGIGVVSTEAFTAGIASVPEPFSDADWGGWYVWRSFSSRFEFLDATGTILPAFNFEVDSKAMRKVASNETLVMVAEAQVGAYSISTPLRTLVELH